MIQISIAVILIINIVVRLLFGVVAEMAFGSAEIHVLALAACLDDFGLCCLAGTVGSGICSRKNSGVLDLILKRKKG